MKFTIFFFGLIFVSFSFTSCKKAGCTDYYALNYDTEAKVDDNSCYYFWIGQNYQGGKIFYIDRSRKHGMISADFNLDNIEWGCSGGSGDSITVSGINETAVGKGSSNSQIIADVCGYETAAGKCLLLDTLGYDDWYLPSMEEMRGVSENLGRLGQANLKPGYYWSSSQVSARDAYLILNANRASAPLAKGVAYNVRPVRSF